MVENYRTGLVWESFMANPEICEIRSAGTRPVGSSNLKTEYACSAHQYPAPHSGIPLWLGHQIGICDLPGRNPTALQCVSEMSISD
jgi:hypothetical protein